LELRWIAASAVTSKVEDRSMRPPRGYQIVTKKHQASAQIVHNDNGDDNRSTIPNPSTPGSTAHFTQSTFIFIHTLPPTASVLRSNFDLKLTSRLTPHAKFLASRSHPPFSRWRTRLEATPPTPHTSLPTLSTRPQRFGVRAASNINEDVRRAHLRVVLFRGQRRRRRLRPLVILPASTCGQRGYQSSPGLPRNYSSQAIVKRENSSTHFDKSLATRKDCVWRMMKLGK